jgi:dihydroorotate dehydrogenase (fumarate)/dihydroorotate dehydrogenase
MGLYSRVIKPVAFALDPERAHHLAIGLGGLLGPVAGLAPLPAPDPRLATEIAGIRFANPIGLAAGFDKSGGAVATLARLGFGGVEIGSVSVDPSEGNPRPRLWRLPEDRAIVVAYGLPNEGADAITQRLARVRLPVPLGINIVKTNRGPGCPEEPADAIIAEYAEAARRYAPAADYLMVNLSCPNTADGRDFFADPNHLSACLAAIGETHGQVPVFLKVSPVGGIATIERVLAAADPHRWIAGFMFNLPPGKPDGLRTPAEVWKAWPGAVSGPPFSALADSSIREMYRRMDRDRYAIIGSGGVASAADAWAKIRNGASFVQLLTALIYKGPGVVRAIVDGLGPMVEAEGFRSVAEAVGIDATNKGR